MRVTAAASGSVTNKAAITYEFESGGNTEDDPQNPEVTNPVGSYKKVDESSAAGRNGMAVKENDEVTFEIGWNAPAPEAGRILKQVMIEDEVPEGMEPVSLRDSYGFFYQYDKEAGRFKGGNVSGEVGYENGVISWNITNQAKLDSGTVYVTMRVTEDASAAITNQADLKYRYGDPDNNDNDVITDDPGKPEITIPVGAYKRVTSAAGYKNKPISIGEEITYEIGWLDPEETEALTKVTISDTLQHGLQLVGATDSSGTYKAAGSLDGELAFDGETIKWTIEGSSLGRTGKVSITVRVLETVGDSVTNRADIVYFHGDPDNGTEDPGNPEVINQVGSYKVVDDKSESGKNGAPVKPGEEITYDIGWLNPRTGHPLIGINITDEVTEGLELVGAYGMDGTLYAFNSAAETFETGAADAGLTYENGAARWRMTTTWENPFDDYGVVKVVMRVTSDAKGTVTNRANLVYTNYDMDYHDETETDDPKQPEITNPLGAYKRVENGSSGYADAPVKAGAELPMNWAGRIPKMSLLYA